MLNFPTKLRKFLRKFSFYPFFPSKIFFSHIPTKHNVSSLIVRQILIFIFPAKFFTNFPKAVTEEADLARDEKCEFIPFCAPKQVIRRNGRIVALELYKTDKDENDNTTFDEDQFIRLKCDFVISAFGSQAAEPALLNALQPVTITKSGTADIDFDTMQAKVKFFRKFWKNSKKSRKNQEKFSKIKDFFLIFF